MLRYFCQTKQTTAFYIGLRIEIKLVAFSCLRLLQRNPRLGKFDGGLHG